MSDLDAVSALLMLSQGMQDQVYPQQIRAHASSNFNFYEDDQENRPEDLSKVKRELFVNNSGKRLLTQSNYPSNEVLKPVNNSGEYNMIQQFPTKTPALAPYNQNVSQSKSDVMETGPYYEHNYASNNFLHSTEESISLSNYTAPSYVPCQTGIVHSKLSAPTLPQWTNGDPRENLPPQVLFEFDRLMRDSSFVKEEFVKQKTAEFPIDTEYNPKKSRLRKEYANAEEAAGRAKNNLASRRSRYKKKVQTQLMNLSLAFDKDENRDLYLQEKWLNEIIGDLEGKLLGRNFDMDKLREIRATCGFK